ncbi:hypothetical protein ASF11_16400 [Acidovorax sp. Leaf76]|uniref:hypothetical protein n=1 Tax=unclassified Acidovorax TaxID=2684926 RepID=UPI0006F7A9AD|nr:MULTISPECIES: hypothetical protein [unclassified Acidovorax]KQO12591.1 hypothetical protein ASF11_16400 [Acidovorax sp. Leaf76]KQO30199.1 hypothetical protein ASF19_14080 [Acidovorax sp. Leaf84]KQS28731.1 hypothetical protein ASG27_10460 [Acidovorax sp. Leaf191]
MFFVTVNRRFAVTALVAGGVLAAVPAAAAPLPQDASPTARRLVRWATDTADHQGLPFAVIDKPAARIHVFSAQGQWLGSSPVLLGAALGDRSAPDIGQRPLSQIRPEERTTPAGRFVTEPGRNLKGDDIVWIDYDAAVSLHRVRSVSAAERRHQRLASQGAQDKRISYGCVNAPEAFYNQFIAPLFGQSRGVIYVLPDTEPFATIFVAASAY